MLVEHGDAANELEDLQLTKSDKSKQRPSRTKAPNQEIKQREPAKRILIEENQSPFADPFRRTSRFLPR